MYVIKYLCFSSVSLIKQIASKLDSQHIAPDEKLNNFVPCILKVKKIPLYTFPDSI